MSRPGLAWEPKKCSVLFTASLWQPPPPGSRAEGLDLTRDSHSYPMFCSSGLSFYYAHFQIYTKVRKQYNRLPDTNNWASVISSWPILFHPNPHPPPQLPLQFRFFWTKSQILHFIPKCFSICLQKIRTHFLYRTIIRRSHQKLNINVHVCELRKYCMPPA